MTIDLSKLSEVPREHLELWFRYTWSHAAFKVEGPLADKLRVALTPKLRTRSEVDAEIATMVRIAYGAGSVELTSGAVRMTSQIEHLCAEPVRDDDPEQDERLLDVLRQALDMAPDASEATVLARVCKLRQEATQPDRMTEAVSVLHKALQRAENLAQGWRDSAFDSAHMSKLKSDTLEECAAELDAVIATAAPDERRAKTKGEKDLAEPLPSAIKGPPMTRDEYLVSARRLSPDPRTEPDPRPKCIRCAMRWTPPEGVDATVTPCFDCCYVDPATELERIRTALGEIRGVIEMYKKYAPLQVCVDIDEILKGVGA